MFKILVIYEGWIGTSTCCQMKKLEFGSKMEASNAYDSIVNTNVGNKTKLLAIKLY